MSNGLNGQHVHFTPLPDGRVTLRDTLDLGGPALTFSSAAWAEFLRKVRHDPAAYWSQPVPETREQIDEAAGRCMREARRLSPPYVDEDPPRPPGPPG